MARYHVADLERCAASLLAGAGVDADKATTVARLLVLTDAMGRRTHGLAMLPLYLAELAKGGKGGMRASGEPTIVNDNGVSAVWDGDYLPGLWLVNRAIEIAMPRASQYGIAATAIRRSHHIGCLAALVKQAADRGYIAQIWNSDPAGKRVAPYGGTEALFTPNPYAIGYPGTPNPVLVDSCASITTTSMTRQKVAAGEPFEHAWLLDADGVPTRDPRVLEHAERRGSLQLVGGVEYGHKGFGLALTIEALSQGLSGHGRKDAPARWGGNVFVQIIDPGAFAGRGAFAEQMDFLSARCRANAPIDPQRPVRMPGDAAARGIADAKEHGIAFDDAAWAALQATARERGVEPPAPI